VSFNSGHYIVIMKQQFLYINILYNWRLGVVKYALGIGPICVVASSLSMLVVLIIPSIRSIMSALVSDHEQGTSCYVMYSVSREKIFDL